MFGGAPMMTQPGFVPMQQPIQRQPILPRLRQQPLLPNRPRPLQALGQAAPQRQQPANPAPLVQAPVPAPIPYPPKDNGMMNPGLPKVRAQNSEEAAPSAPAVVARVALSLPPPEELGVQPAPAPASRPVAVDWNAVHARLRELGAVSFCSQKLTDGSYRVTCALPTAQPERRHMVEVDAGSEEAAVAAALQRVEQWARR